MKRLHYWCWFAVWFPLKSLLGNVLWCIRHPARALWGRGTQEFVKVAVTGLEGLKSKLATISYVPDDADWQQWPSVTLEKGTADCEDYAALACWMFTECLGWKASLHFLIRADGDAHAVCLAYDPKMVVYGRPYSWCITDNLKVDMERGHVTLADLMREPSYAWSGRDIFPEVEWQK